MIEHIEGILIDQEEGECFIKVGQISLKIFVASYIPTDSSNTCSLFISTLWKETGPQLYGFLQKQDKKLFEELIKISGVGPRTALTAIKAIGCSGIRNALAQNDCSSLIKIKGLGKKTAERIFLELKTKYLEKICSSSSDSQEACSALVSLGYPKKDAKSVIEKILTDSTQPLVLEDLVREALLHFKQENCKSYTWNNHEID